MTSPKKNIDQEQENTMFGQLIQIQKSANMLNKTMLDELEQITRLKSDFGGMEKEGKMTAHESKVKINQEIKQFENRIKNYLTLQKAQYMRFSNQINIMIQQGKQINSHLNLLNSKFVEFQKNVGI